MRKVLTWLALALAPAAAQIKVPVWVQAGEGGYQTGLAAKQFQAFLEDKPARIRAVLGPADNLVLLLVLDLTGELARVEAFRAALAEEVGRFGPRQFIGLLDAQDGLRVIADPTPDRQVILAGVEQAALGGKSGLLDTIETAAGIGGGILRKAAVRVALLYVTDSSISNYRTDYTNPVINSSDHSDLSRRFPERLVQERATQLVRSLETCQAPIFIFHLENRDSRIEEAYQNGLKQMAEATAGDAVFCRAAAEIPESFRQMMDRIRSGYVLSLDTPAGARRLRVRVEAGEAVRVSFRSRFDLK